MKSDVCEALLEDLTGKISRCMNNLDKFLVPPFNDFPGDQLAAAIRDETGSDAVSLFLVDREVSPHKLSWAGGVGYRDRYKKVVYFLDGPYLTSHVYREKASFNKSKAELERLAAGHELPFSGRCQGFIETDRFINLIAVPIVFEEKALGVLKIENKGANADDVFPPVDFALARVVSSIIGLAYQQQTYAQLWREGERARAESRTYTEFLQKATELLAKRLNAECASVFLIEQSERDDDILRYAAGVGYREGYTKHAYNPGSPRESLTAYVAASRFPLRCTEKELKEGQYPYSGACSSYIRSGFFRNILAFPLLRGEHDCLGVLKIENRMPEGTVFDHHDEEICRAFVDELIVPVLSAHNIGLRKDRTEGFKLLVRLLGPPTTSKSGLKIRVTSTRELQKKHSAIRVEDCVNYLQISKPHYYRLVKSTKDSRAVRTSDINTNSTTTGDGGQGRRTTS